MIIFDPMRKLLVSMNVSLDGYMSDADSGLGWHFRSWNEDMTGYACRQLSRADTILLGRNTYEAMSEYWPWQPVDSAFSKEDIAYASMMNNFRKIVFSRSLKRAGWKNTEVISDRLQQNIIDLKKQHGKDIVLFGSSKIIDTILPLQLIDEFIIWIFPVILGKGKLLFKNLVDDIVLTTTNSELFDSGVIVVHYCT